MAKKETKSFMFKSVYPSMRYFMALGRNVYGIIMKLKTKFSKRPTGSSVIPDNYTVCNTSTYDSDYNLTCLEGAYPNDVSGAFFLCQCLGVPEAFMVGDTNIVKMDFEADSVHLKNRLFWNPAAIARIELEKTKHRFDYFGLMYLSPGLGMFSYTKGMYLLPDGRLAITSDVDRPWVIDRDVLKAATPIGRRDEWIPMMSGSAGEAMGQLFSGYSNSHVMYTDHETDEVFFANYQYKQPDGSHPCQLMKWDGIHDFQSWMVTDESGEDIEIKQSIHELIFTRDYILLADTAFVAGTEMLTPWKNAPLPSDKTVVHIIDRRDLDVSTDKVMAKRVEVDEPCIHLIAAYENPDDVLTVYMLHTPATNTAEILRHYDKDLNGQLFSKNVIGYGTLPVLDLSSVGKHHIDMKTSTVLDSKYIAETPYCWGPYLYTYMGRQIEPFNGQDLYIMFKGFNKDILPKRIYEAYKDVDNRRMSIQDMVEGDGIRHNNSICRITTTNFEIAEGYVFPDKVLLYTIACMDSKDDGDGYVIAGVVTDDYHEDSSGHEYWLFEAKNLAKGPICKLGHPMLNNSTIFHTVYIPEAYGKKLDEKDTSYHVSLREDYPREALKKWEPCVMKAFEDIIWPYFDKEATKDQVQATQHLKSVATKRISEHVGKEHLIGEAFVENGPQYAERMFEEVERMWKTTGWQVESKKHGVIVESKPISGDLASSGILVTRSSGVVQANAQQTFDMLVSPEGYGVIDPVSNKEDHEIPPFEVYDWKDGCRLEAAVARTNIPMMPQGEFVVLNAIDSNIRLFASKSILHEKSPGGSKYSQASYPENGLERALNTFAIKVIPVDEETCQVLCINYADIGGKSSGGMNNFVNTKLFFPPLYKRIAKAMS